MSGAIYSRWEREDAAPSTAARGPARQRRPVPWLRTIMVSTGAVAGLVHLAGRSIRDQGSTEPGPVPAAVLIAPAPSWTPIAHPAALYGVAQTTLPVTYEARQQAAGGREDSLTLGGLGDSGYARVSFVSGVSDPQGRSLFIEMVHRAAEAGLSVVRSAPSRTMATKFGPIETASVTLAGSSAQSCQAFRLADPTMRFGFQGWLCAGGSEALEDRQVACFIDRVELGGVADPNLKALFTQAEARRLPECVGSGPASVAPPLGPEPAPVPAREPPAPRRSKASSRP